MAKQCYFLPRPLKKRVSGTKGIRFQRSFLGTSDNFKVPGFALRGHSRTIKAFLRRNKLAGADWGVCNGEVRTILRPDPSLRAAPLILSSPEVEKTLKERPGILKDFESALSTFSDRIGMKVQLHFVNGPSFPPYAKNDANLHLVVGASPPGNRETLERQTICGILLNDRGAYVQGRGPALGYGIIVRDDQKGIVSQIIGNTFYLFIPTIENLNRALFFGTQGIELFTRVLALTWNVYADNAAEPTPAPIASAKEYTSLMQGNLSLYSKVQRRSIEEVDEELQEALRNYRDKLNLKRILLAAEKAYLAIAEANSDFDRDWKILKSHPLIAQVGTLDDTLFIETKWIIHEFEGTKYKLGRYMIRKPIGVPSGIWALETPHPDRIPHPHISAHGIVCYGNATQAIEEAVGEMRTVDELELILRWLSEGYSPSLAMAHIEQWPTVE